VRQTGKIVRWNADRGFGFVRPENGGQEVFAHISSFRDRARVPKADDGVTYELGHDAQSRTKAERIVYAGAFQALDGERFVPLGLAASALLFVLGAASAGRLPSLISAWYVAASLGAFVSYALDKSAAQNGRWRTSEKTLHLFSLAGGWPGAMAAQTLLRHKTRKKEFRVVFWGTVALNCAALGWMFSARGGMFLRSVLGDYGDMKLMDILHLVIGRIA